MTDRVTFGTGADVAGPRHRPPHRHGDDDANESAHRIEGESVDIEREAPVEDNVSEQRVEPDNQSTPAPFEE